MLYNELYLQPEELGRDYATLLSNKARRLLEGKFLRKYGYLLMVVDTHVVKELSAPLVDVDTGDVQFMVSVDALFFRAFIHEYIFACVSSVSKDGLMCSYGLITKVFIHSSSLISKGYRFDEDGRQWVSESEEEYDPIRQGAFVQAFVIQVGVEGNERMSCIAQLHRSFLQEGAVAVK